MLLLLLLLLMMMIIIMILTGVAGLNAEKHSVLALAAAEYSFHCK